MIQFLLRIGAHVETPVLTLTSGSSDNTPDFDLTADLAELDTVRFQYATASDFTGASDVTNTIDAAEDAANELIFSTGALADATWYFRARVERPPGTIGRWSNTETLTISTTQAGFRGLLGFWNGGFGTVINQGAFRSLLAFWSGGAAIGGTTTEEILSGTSGTIKRRRRSLVDLYGQIRLIDHREQQARQEAERLEREIPKPLVAKEQNTERLEAIAAQLRASIEALTAERDEILAAIELEQQALQDDEDAALVVMMLS